MLTGGPRPKYAQPLLLLTTLLLGACVSSGDRPPAQADQPPPISIAGLESVIGANQRLLVGQLGPVILDIREGTARKLQFVGPVCVLDAYLYPRQAGGEPVVTYVDARMPDGRDMDRASCVAALNARQQVR
ncbi:MAG: hypothetical protein H0W74_08220 [Sphingosinicella sp.]|nr:hypothetical protein [Sphingosinicella sp.]